MPAARCCYQRLRYALRPCHASYYAIADYFESPLPLHTRCYYAGYARRQIFTAEIALRDAIHYYALLLLTLYYAITCHALRHYYCLLLSDAAVGFTIISPHYLRLRHLRRPPPHDARGARGRAGGVMSELYGEEGDGGAALTLRQPDRVTIAYICCADIYAGFSTSACEPPLRRPDALRCTRHYLIRLAAP